MKMVKIEVHMEAGAVERLYRIGPFADQSSFGIVPVHHFPDFTPHRSSSRFPVIIVFDQGIRHIHPEAVTSLIQPETHDILQCFSCGNRFL